MMGVARLGLRRCLSGGQLSNLQLLLGQVSSYPRGFGENSAAGGFNKVEGGSRSRSCDLIAFAMTADPDAWSTTTQDHEAWRAQLNTGLKFYTSLITSQTKILTIFGDNII
jgi:hypothetical protein